MPVRARITRVGALAAALAAIVGGTAHAEPGDASLSGPTPKAGLADQGATRDAAASLPRQPINF
jgi:hypothetical protein